MKIPSGVTDQYIYFVAVDSTDLKTRETGLSTFTVYRSRNGGVATAMTTPTVNETDSTNMPGVYELLVDEDTTLDSGDDSQEMVFHITATGMAPVTRTVEIYRPKVTAGETIGVSSGAVTNVGTVATNSDKTGYSISGTKTTLDALNDIAATDIVSGGAITTSSGAVSNVTTVATTTTNTDMRGTDGAYTGTPPTAAAISDAVWDEALSGHNVAGSTGKALRQLKEGVISQDGAVNDTSATTTTFVTNLTSSTNGFYHDKVIVFVSGTLSGQARHIETYNGTTKAITVSKAFTSAPSNADEFLILATHEHSLNEIADAVLDEVLSGHTTAGTLGKAVADIEADTNELQSDDVPGLIAALNDLSTTDILGMAYESTEDFQDFLRLTRAVLLGKTTGAGTGTENFRDRADGKNRVVSTIDSNGDRTAITTDAT